MKKYQVFLSEELKHRKDKNPRYSLRAFAKQLEISPGQLSNLMIGRKKLSITFASKIIEKLNLDEADAADLFNEMLPSKHIPHGVPEQHLLADDEFKLISEWSHFAILSLSQLKTNRADVKWISERLQIKKQTAKDNFLRLKRMGLIKIRSDGRFEQTTKPLVTTTDIPSAAIRSYHKQCLDLAKEKIENIPTEFRDFSTITMGVNLQKIKKAKKMINEFKHKLCRELEDSKTSEVYTFSMQLFPLSRLTGDL